MRKKLEQNLIGRESVDDPYVWENRDNFNVFAEERRDYI